MVSWFTRRRDAVEAAPELVEDVDDVDAVTALLAAAHLPTESCGEQLGGVPAGVRAAADDRTLAVVVEEGHPPRAHDRALALALSGAEGRRIALLIPGNEPDLVLATRARAAMLTGTAVDLYTYDGMRAMVHPPLSERMLRSGAAEPEGLLLDAEYRVPLRLVPVAEAIEEWAADVGDLTPRHLKSARAWVCEGKRVLSMRAVRAGLRVFAGARDESRPDHGPLTLTLTGPPTPAQLAAIAEHVAAAVRRRQDERAAGYREYRATAIVARCAHQLGWDQGLVLRQVPGRRPGGAHGRVPYLRLDGDRQLHVVEVAHRRTELLAVRALDAWIWATENRAGLAAHLGVPDFSAIVLDIVVAVGPGGGADAGGVAGDASLEAPRGVERALPEEAAVTADDELAASDSDDAEYEGADDGWELAGQIRTAIPTALVAQLSALSPSVAWAAHELVAWDTPTPVLRTTARSGRQEVEEHTPLMPASIAGVDSFMQMLGTPRRATSEAAPTAQVPTQVPRSGATALTG